jgi:hypothetical protein
MHVDPEYARAFEAIRGPIIARQRRERSQPAAVHRAAQRADRQKRFLEEYKTRGLILQAARFVGIDPGTFRQWLRRYPEFAAMFDRIRSEGEARGLRTTAGRPAHRAARVALALAEDLSSRGGADALRALMPQGCTPAAPPPRSPLQGLPTGTEIAMRRWEAIGRDLLNRDFELTLEEATPLFATFTQLVNKGVRFDPTLSALVGVLKRQGFKNDGESDYDHRAKRSPAGSIAVMPRMHLAAR